MFGAIQGLMLSGLLVCSSPQPVSVDVAVRSPQPTIQTQKSAIQLTSAFAAVDSLGDYSGSVVVEYLVQIGQPTQGKGFKCMALEKITVTVVHEAALRVANDFDQDTCAHRAIAQHEQEHYQIDRDIAAKYAARLQDGLALAFSAESPLLVPVAAAPDEVNRISGQVAAVIENLGSGMMEERAAMQSAIDTPGSYRRLFEGCGSINH